MKAWLVLIATIAFCASPFLTEGFAGFRPDQFPIPQDNAPVQPAGYAFSIWGVIYLWLLLSAALGLWKYRDDPDWEAARLPLILSLGFGAFWIKVATISVIWATILIFFMCITALFATWQARRAGPFWALSLPLGLYAGWLSAASFVALGLTGAGYGIAGSALFWAWAMLGVAAGFAALVQRKFTGVWTYGLAVSWALIGITLKNWGAETLFAQAALLSAVLILGLAFYQLRAPR